MFDHLTTDEIVEHMTRVERELQRPTGIAFTLQDLALLNREYAQLENELLTRDPRKAAS